MLAAGPLPLGAADLCCFGGALATRWTHRPGAVLPRHPGQLPPQNLCSGPSGSSALSPQHRKCDLSLIQSPGYVFRQAWC